MIRRLAPVLLAAVALLGTMLLATAPAEAAVSGSTSSGDVVLFDQCIQHDVSYSLQIGAGTTLWNLHINVLDAEGITAQVSDVSSAAGSPTSGTVHVLFCGAEMPGTWSVVGEGFTESLPGIQVPFTLPTSRFQVSPAATRTTLAHHALGHGRYLVTVRVRDQRPHGFGRTASAQVRLERLTHGHWSKVRGPRLLTDHGQVTTTVSGHHGTRVRAVTAADGNYGSSTSRVARL